MELLLEGRPLRRCDRRALGFAFTRERQCTRLRLIGGLTGASGRGDRGDEDQRRNQLR